MIVNDVLIERIKKAYADEKMLPDEKHENYKHWLDEINNFIGNHSGDTEENIMIEIHKRIEEEKDKTIEKWLSIFSV